MDKIDPGPGYRLLEADELVQEGDEFSLQGEWVKSDNWSLGASGRQTPFYPYRRKLPELVSGIATPSIPEPSGTTFSGTVEGMPQTVSEQSGTTVEELVAPIPTGVKIRAPWPSADLCRKSLEAAGIKPEDFAKSPGAQVLQQDFAAMEAKIYGTLASLGLLHLLPRPFTRNKYTRDLKALDGRVVPVDPYVVSGAFNLADVIHNGEALDATIHARKKLLAPGQRGAKGVLQDLKEAHASLGRAISALEQEGP